LAAIECEKVRYESEPCEHMGRAGEEANLQTGWFGLLMKGCGFWGRAFSRLGVGVVVQN